MGAEADAAVLFGLPGGGPNLDVLGAAERAGLRFVLAHGETGAAISQVMARYADSRRRIQIANSDGLLTGDDQTRVSTPRALNVTRRTATEVDLVWLASTDNVAVVGYELVDADSGAVLATTPGLSMTLTTDAGSAVAVRAYDGRTPNAYLESLKIGLKSKQTVKGSEIVSN